VEADERIVVKNVGTVEETSLLINSNIVLMELRYAMPCYVLTTNKSKEFCKVEAMTKVEE